MNANGTDEQKKDLARDALELVCSGRGFDPVRHYAPAFVDHVNGQHLRGIEGVAESVARYRNMLDSISIRVEQQTIDGDMVTSRFVVTGLVRSRPVRFDGITVSRIENGLIIEDWSVTDTLGLLRQAGFSRLLLLLVRSWRTGRGWRRP